MAWHCGAASYRHPHCRNHNSIGIELCSRKGEGGYVFLPQTVERAAMLTRSLMERYGLGPEDVLRHYDVTGKLCPRPLIGEDKWAAFKARLEDTMTQEQFNAMMDIYLAQSREKPVSDWAKNTWDKAMAAGVFDGTAPQNPLTREQAALVLDRLGLLEGKEG